jgi:antitoxin HicB
MPDPVVPSLRPLRIGRSNRLRFSFNRETLSMKRERLENLLGYEIKIIPDQESGYFGIRFPDFPGIITGGYDLREAVGNAQEVLDFTIDKMREQRIPLPKPKARFSGQFNVRVPKDLHRALISKAEEEGVSLNAMVNYLLTRSLREEKAA